MKLFSNKGKHCSQGQHQSREKNEAARPAASPQNSKRKRKWLIVAIVVLALVLLTMIGVAAFSVWATAPEVEDEGLVSRIPEAGTEEGEVLEPVATPEPQPTAEPEESPLEAESPQSGRRSGTYTVLLVGEDVAGMNTDTIMVGMLDTEAGKLNVVSIPRDMLVNVSWSVKKVNSVYGMTGTEEGLVEGISELLGYKVDNYAVVNVYAFEEVIDAIGGVYFDVPMHMSWGDPTIGRNYDIPAGNQWLNGYNAMGVVRFRQNTDGTGYPTGDIGRVNTQQQFALALVKQMLKLGNIPNLSKVIEIITDNLKTDLTAGNLAFFAQEFLKLDDEDITFSVMPYEPVYIKGGSYVCVKLSEWLDMLNTDLNPYYETITERNLDILTFVNGSFYATTGVLAGGYDSFYDYTNLTS